MITWSTTITIATRARCFKIPNLISYWKKIMYKWSYRRLAYRGNRCTPRGNIFTPKREISFVYGIRSSRSRFPLIFIGKYILLSVARLVMRYDSCKHKKRYSPFLFSFSLPSFSCSNSVNACFPHCWCFNFTRFFSISIGLILDLQILFSLLSCSQDYDSLPSWT